MLPLDKQALELLTVVIRSMVQGRDFTLLISEDRKEKVAKCVSTLSPADTVFMLREAANGIEEAKTVPNPEDN